MQEGFVDLRLNGEHSGDESFWPSFTDIMMVIVLIFMLAMVTLLVKNMDLVHQLRSSLAAQQTATMQAHSATDINMQLNKRLQRLEEQAAMLQMRLMNLGEEHSRSLAQLKASEQENTQLKASLSAITVARDTTLAEKSLLKKNQIELSAILQQREQELQQRQKEMTAQQQQYQLRLAEIASLKNNSNTQLDRLTKIEAEYANLESKYNKLIRPARSSLGKYVVLVRYHKQAGHLIMEIKSLTAPAYTVVSDTQLHMQLSKLKEKYGKKLYVRIIFPDNSGLSYTQAWNITQSLLRMYDYYYQG